MCAMDNSAAKNHIQLCIHLSVDLKIKRLYVRVNPCFGQDFDGEN